MNIENKTISLLFTRWVVMHYDSDYLNKIDGDAWNELYEYFSKNVLVKYKLNKTYKDSKEFYKKVKLPARIKVIEKIVELPLKTIYVQYESNGCDCGQVSCGICN